MKQLTSIFAHFFYLGCISFGGPAAHLGYFQRYFIDKHQWLDLPMYSRMVALSQFLPGPSSSQVGFSIGYHRAGVLGAFTAFIAFTLPSFILMMLIAVLGFNFANSITVLGAIYGLKLLAVVVVADAVISMAKVFCQHTKTKVIAALASSVMILSPSLWVQVTTLLLAGGIGLLLHKTSEAHHNKQGSNANNNEAVNDAVASTRLFSPLAITAFVIFILAFILPSLYQGEISALFSSFYQAGSLVFGGGHVVLPLLEQTIEPALSTDTFIMGYASAQAMPGPMFTLATYLGANYLVASPFIGALVATIAIFLPGFLLILMFQHHWHQLAFKPKVAGFIMGVNAAVVGLLAAAFYQPIAMNAIFDWLDVLSVLVGFVLLKTYRLPILALVLGYISFGILMVL